MTSSHDFIRKCPECGKIRSVFYTDLYPQGIYNPKAMMCCGKEIPYDPNWCPVQPPEGVQRFVEEKKPSIGNAKNILKFLQELESVQRFSKNRPIWQENLVYHIGVVATLSLFLLNKMTEEYGEEIFTSQDACELLARSVVHDFGEVITGDIIRPTKYATNGLSEAINCLETRGVKDAIQKYALPKIWEQDWLKGKEDKVGLLLKVADAAAVAVTCRRELWLFSNKSFLKTTAECRTYIEKVVQTLTYKNDHCKDQKFEFVYTFLQTFLLEINEILSDIINHYENGEK
jgi:5'-deoxynucleotidase YfbR-like HD superfamily hydrolase